MYPQLKLVSIAGWCVKLAKYVGIRKNIEDSLKASYTMYEQSAI